MWKCKNCGCVEMDEGPWQQPFANIGYGYWSADPNNYPTLAFGKFYYMSGSHDPQDGKTAYTGLPFKILERRRISEATASFTLCGMVETSNKETIYMVFHVDDKIFECDTNEQVPIKERPKLLSMSPLCHPFGYNNIYTLPKPLEFVHTDMMVEVGKEYTFTPGRSAMSYEKVTFKVTDFQENKEIVYYGSGSTPIFSGRATEYTAQKSNGNEFKFYYPPLAMWAGTSPQIRGLGYGTLTEKE